MEIEKYNKIREYLLRADRIFRKLKDKKLINRKKQKEIMEQLKLLNYYLLVNNPKIQSSQFKQENILSFLNYLKKLREEKSK